MPPPSIWKCFPRAWHVNNWCTFIAYVALYFFPYIWLSIYVFFQQKSTATLSNVWRIMSNSEVTCRYVLQQIWLSIGQTWLIRFLRSEIQKRLMPWWLLHFKLLIWITHACLVWNPHAPVILTKWSIAEQYEKLLLLRCIHLFISDLINNMDHIQIRYKPKTSVKRN